ncbi:MAG: hypothetical protein Q4D81_03985 [Eubacteriales bacterium]|nr:hypothetical protein [Eubacteriales bacterium]
MKKILFMLLIVYALAPAMSVQADSLLSYAMTPVYPQDIEDGEYTVEARSDSKYFNVKDAVLTVRDGQMRLRFTIPSLSYLYVYEGTAKEARKAEESDWIPREQEGETSVFEITADALNKEIPCAAYSKARKRWYGRNLVIYAASLPADALRISLPDYDLIDRALAYYEEAGFTDGEKAENIKEAETSKESETALNEETAENASAQGKVSAVEDAENAENKDSGAGFDTGKSPEAVRVDLDDGEYSIECNMTGGSGRASISSPALFVVRDGRAYARLIWSSTYYDYMLVDGVRYENLTTDGGNSSFEIPVTVMDEGMTVIADTTAMGDPVEIEYVLTFYSDSIGDRGLVPQEAAKKVLTVALVIIVAGGILNHFVKKSRQ